MDGTLEKATALASQLRKRPREPFIPDSPYPGDLADEAALMKWVAASLPLQRAPRVR